MAKRTYRKVKSNTTRRKSRKRTKRTVKRKATSRQMGGALVPAGPDTTTLFHFLETLDADVILQIAKECIKLLKIHHGMGNYFTCRRIARVFLGVDIITRLQGHGGVCGGAKLYLENVRGVRAGEPQIQFLRDKTLCEVCRPFLTPFGQIRYAVIDSLAKFAEDSSPDDQSAFMVKMREVITSLPSVEVSEAIVGGSMRKFERHMDEAIQGFIQKYVRGGVTTMMTTMMTQLDSNITEILCHPLCYSDISGTNVLVWAENVKSNLFAYIKSFKVTDEPQPEPESETEPDPQPEPEPEPEPEPQHVTQLRELLRYSIIVKRLISSFYNKDKGGYGLHYILNVPDETFAMVDGVGSLREQASLAILKHTIGMETLEIQNIKEFIEGTIGQELVLEGAHNQAHRNLVEFFRKCCESIPENYKSERGNPDLSGELLLKLKLEELISAYVDLTVNELDEGDSIRGEFVSQANKLLSIIEQKSESLIELYAEPLRAIHTSIPEIRWDPMILAVINPTGQ